MVALVVGEFGTGLTVLCFHPGSFLWLTGRPGVCAFGGEAIGIEAGSTEQ